MIHAGSQTVAGASRQSGQRPAAARAYVEHTIALLNFEQGDRMLIDFLRLTLHDRGYYLANEALRPGTLPRDEGRTSHE